MFRSVYHVEDILQLSGPHTYEVIMRTIPFQATRHGTETRGKLILIHL
jgi:hypothetical protein